MMKRTVLLLALVGAVSIAAVSEQISLAVVQVEALNVEAGTARLVEDVLQTELAKIKLFRLVERGRLDAVMREQELQLSQITSAESAAQAGNVLNVQKVVFGSLALYDSAYVKYLLSLRLVDVERAAIEAAESVEIRNDEQIIASIRDVVQKLTSHVEVVGRITGTENSSVYISLGELSGVKVDDVVSVTAVELIRDDDGRVIMREEKSIANLLVEKVSPEGSRCRILELAGELETGLSVRPGKSEIEKALDTSGLEVRSVPDNANVFLDGKYLGITPLKLTDMEPGSYRLEIRSGEGYKPYAGKINLRPGRTVSLERELDREIDVEDILLFGRIPRKQTNPTKALVRALLPGLGAVYNGYAGHMPAMLTSMAFYGTAAGQYIQNGLASSPSLIMLGTIGLIYGSSFIDAWLSAKQDFLYPSYFELFACATGSVWFVPDGNGSALGVVSEVIYEGYRIFFDYGIVIALPIVALNIDFQYRIFTRKNMGIGIGTMYFVNLWAGNAAVEPPDHFISPALSFSYRTPKWECDATATPYAWLANAFGDDSKNLIGIRARGNVAYFFTLKAGLLFGLEYSHLADIEDLSAFKLHFLWGKAGIIMRL